MKYRLLWIFIISVLLSGCKAKSVTSEKNGVILKEQNVDYEVKPIEKVRQELDVDYQDLLDGKYDKLLSEDFDIVFTDEAEIHNIIYTYNFKTSEDYVINSSNFKNKFERINTFVNTFFSSPNKDNYIIRYDDLEKHQYSENLFNCILDGKYDNKNIEFITYTHDKDNSVMISPSSVTIRMGIHNDEISFNDSDVWTAKRYYSYSKTANFNDEYTMISGEKMTINEGMEFVNNTVLKEFEKLYGEKIIEKEIIDTYVIQHDDVYSFKYYITFRYDGLPFDYYMSSAYGDSTNLALMSLSRVDIVGKNKLSFALLHEHAGFIREEGETLTEIISLKDALDILNNAIGDTSKYNILDIKFQYRSSNENVVDNVVTYNAYPSWGIRAVSINDGHTYFFYINAVSGEIEKNMIN